MAKTISESFSQFRRNLEITSAQLSNVSTRHNNIRNLLSKEMRIEDTFLTGSYSRSTMIAPLSDSDIDIFIVLNPMTYYLPGSKRYIFDEMLRILNNYYSETKNISKNGEAITICFSDFQVDVVPSFKRGGDGYHIINANTTGEIQTNPKYHAELMTEENSQHNGNLVPIVKMIKAWNRNKHYPFVSFYLEMLAIRIFKDFKIEKFSDALYYFFDNGKALIEEPLHDPVSYGGIISPYRECKSKVDALKIFTYSTFNALCAVRDEKAEIIENSINRWRDILGNSFPAYG